MFVQGTYLRRALGNSAWLFAERGITLALNLLISVLLARHLGAANFGSLSYALAFVALLAIIPYLGLNGLVVQQLFEKQADAPEILGTAIYLRLGAAFFALVSGNAIAQFVVEDPSDRMLILLISLSLLFEPASSLRLLFEAKVDSKWIAIAGSVSSLAGALTRVAAVLADAPLWVFAGLVTIQAIFSAFFFWRVYRSKGRNISPLRYSSVRAKELLMKSWPLILSYAGATIYLKVDQLMLGDIASMEEVARYAVASRLSEVWYVIPTILAGSFFPRLLALRNSDPQAYRRRMTESVRYLFWVGFGIALLITSVATAAVSLLYGKDYQSAGTILIIHIWACPAVFMGMMIEKWFLAEDLLKYLVTRQIFGATLNIGLNLVLIPSWGGEGAAVATVISYTVAYYLSCFTSSRTRPAAIWMTQAMFWPATLAFRRLRNT